MPGGLGLIEYLCTPISNQLPSLAEILNSHVYKGYQPFLCSSSRLETVTDKLVERKTEEKLYHDRSFSDKPVIAEWEMFGIETMLRISGRKEPLYIGMIL